MIIFNHEYVAEGKRKIKAESKIFWNSKQQNFAPPIAPMCTKRLSKAAQRLNQRIKEQYLGFGLSLESRLTD